MRNIWTLISPFPISDKVHAVLNGKIFTVFLDENKRLRFIDACDEGVELLKSTPVVEDSEYTPGLPRTLKTWNTEYLLVNVLDILPTSDRPLSLMDKIAGKKVITSVTGTPEHSGISLLTRVDVTYEDGIAETLVRLSSELDYDINVFIGKTRAEAKKIIDDIIDGKFDGGSTDEEDKPVTMSNVRVVPHHGFGTLAKVIADLSDGRYNVTIFEFFDDEIWFTASELNGLTVKEANALKTERDREYLRSH